MPRLIAMVLACLALVVLTGHGHSPAMAAAPSAHAQPMGDCHGAPAIADDAAPALPECCPDGCDGQCVAQPVLARAPIVARPGPTPGGPAAAPPRAPPSLTLQLPDRPPRG